MDPDIYFPDADHLLGQLADRPDDLGRDHQVQLVIANALTSIAVSLRKIVEGGA